MPRTTNNSSSFDDSIPLAKLTQLTRKGQKLTSSEQNVQRNLLIILDEKCYNAVGKKRFRCRFCGDPKDTAARIQRHVLAHFVPYEMARDMSLAGAKREL
jgi:hypothetical protein